MPAKHIITQQKIDPDRLYRAKEFRRKMTAEEAILWENLRNSRLGGWHFRRQQIIAGFIVDFYCHAAGLVVEVDGPIHLQQVEQDKARQEILMNMGLSILRFPNEDIRTNLAAVLNQIEAGCKDGQAKMDKMDYEHEP